MLSVAYSRLSIYMAMTLHFLRLRRLLTIADFVLL